MLDVLIGGILAVIMFSIGLSLRLRDFQRLFHHPKVLLSGLFLQLVVLPVFSFFVCVLLRLPSVFAVGVMVLSACPGGLTSNFISYLLRANTALSVSLTICNSTLSLLTVPIIINLALDYFGTGGVFGALPLGPTAGRIFAIVLFPVVVGITVRWSFRAGALWLQPKLRWLSIGGLALLFAIKFLAPAESGGSNLTWAEVTTILPASLLVNFGALGLGRLLAVALGFGRNEQLTLGVEVGIQNTSLAFLIAAVLLGNEQVLKPALLYASFTFFTAMAYGFWIKPEMLSELRREFSALRGSTPRNH